MAEIKFDQLKPEQGSIIATVDSKTVNDGNEKMDAHLRKPEFFDVEKFPKITLQSTKIERKESINYIGTFNLTMKGITKEVTIPFTFMKIPGKTEFKGTFKINRLDFGVGESSLTLSDEVEITLVVNVTE